MKHLLPIFIPLAFVAFWCAICFVVALASGWRGLAQRFRATHTPEGQRFGMQSALINGARFNGALTFVVGPQGLYLRMMPVFSLLGKIAPPLLIPWSEISPLQRSNTGRWLRFEMWSVTVALGGSAKTEIALSSRAVAQAIAAFQPGIRV